MNRKTFKKISKTLSVKDIFLLEENTKRNMEYIPPYLDNFHDDKVVLQFRNSTVGYGVPEKDFAESDTNLILYRYLAEFRVMPESQSDNNEAEPLIEASALFGVWYQIKSELNQDELESFGEYNVGYHVWPYWREHVSSLTSKLRIGRVIVPLYNIPEFKDTDGQI